MMSLHLEMLICWTPFYSRHSIGKSESSEVLCQSHSNLS